MPWLRYELNGAGKTLERLSMIAGGTGITPMYQVQSTSCKSWELRGRALSRCSGRLSTSDVALSFASKLCMMLAQEAPNQVHQVSAGPDVAGD